MNAITVLKPVWSTAWDAGGRAMQEQLPRNWCAECTHQCKALAELAQFSLESYNIVSKPVWSTAWMQEVEQRRSSCREIGVQNARISAKH